MLCSLDKILHSKLGTQCFWMEEIFFLAVCLWKRYTKVPEVVFTLLCKDYQGKLTTLLEPLDKDEVFTNSSGIK